jgi:hypothetical protein
MEQAALLRHVTTICFAMVLANEAKGGATREEVAARIATLNGYASETLPNLEGVDLAITERAIALSADFAKLLLLDTDSPVPPLHLLQ